MHNKISITSAHVTKAKPVKLQQPVCYLHQHTILVADIQDPPRHAHTSIWYSLSSSIAGPHVVHNLSIPYVCSQIQIQWRREMPPFRSARKVAYAHDRRSWVLIRPGRTTFVPSFADLGMKRRLLSQTSCLDSD
jgi:hypothetical protein